MNQKITVSRGIQYGIVIVAILLFALIWPLGIVKNTHTSKSDEVILQESDPISVENNGTQMFIPEGSYLKAVELYIANDMQGETITFRLYDGAYQQLWETFYTVDAWESFPGLIRIPIEMEMEEGWEYYYTVEGLTTDLVMYYEDTAESTSFANGTYLYGGMEMPGINLIARYHYSASFSGWQILLFGLLLAAVCFGLWKLVDKLFAAKWSHKNKKITVQRVFQWIFNPLIAMVTLIALLAVFPGRVFGTGVINFGFYYLGILLGAAVLFYVVNYKRTGDAPLISLEQIRKNWTDWAMAVCFGGTLWSCYEYMNGLYDIHHSYATCRLLVWFSLVLIFTFGFTRKELLTIYNLIYLVAASIGGYYYAKPYQGIEEQDELYKLQAYVMVIGGFALLQLIIALVKKAVKKQKSGAGIYFPYALAASVVLALLIIFRNGRTWTVLMAVMFGVFYLRMWMWEGRDRLMKIFSNGLILNFLYMIGYSLMHRPYLRFRHNRFGMGFHTVTMTGYYLALVLSAIVVCLFVQYKKTGRWKDVWKELSLLGIGNVYLFLTLSRTGYLAAFVMEIFILLLMTCMEKKKKGRFMAQTVGVFLGASILFFPVVFTAQRMLPALVNDPIYTEFEVWEYTTEKTTPPNSELYIDITAFIKLAKHKLFGIDMGNISLSSAWEKLGPVYRESMGGLLASTDPMAEEEKDFSNGRIEIFREYIGHWNATGHEDMGVPLENGEISTHAHNTFLQVIHDHGLITGILFLVFGIYTFFLGLYRFSKERTKEPYLALIITVVIAFGAAGMVEWIYHICNPFGFSLMVVITPLLFRRGRKHGKEKI
ncbi:MAG: hypothetical protein IJP31_10410 [Lachnospiraceae bacterium]|nr:hypothetical protein [Lachnospiraceae bacterium]